MALQLDQAIKMNELEKRLAELVKMPRVVITSWTREFTNSTYHRNPVQISYYFFTESGSRGQGEIELTEEDTEKLFKGLG